GHAAARVRAGRHVRRELVPALRYAVTYPRAGMDTAPPPPPPPPPPAVTRIEAGAGLTGSTGLMPELTALGAQVDAMIDAPAIVPVHGFASYWLDRTTQGADFSLV